MHKTLVTGATGFVGRALLPALVEAGHAVRATSRHPDNAPRLAGVEWVACDVERASDVADALDGMDSAYFLVHGMGRGGRAYAEQERACAQGFAAAAANAGVKRIVYLGGVVPRGPLSEHLKSRLHVGEILRSGSVPTLELRASMIVGPGSASWQIVRDLAMRLPAMVLPSWTEARTCPVAIDDVVVALVRALELPLSASQYYDIPGPEALSGRELLFSIAAQRGRRVPSIRVPFLSVSLSSWWLKLVTDTDFSLARELVLGFTGGDLLPEDARYWKEIGYQPRWTFDAAARHALEQERQQPANATASARVSESLVQLVGPKVQRPR